MRSLQIYAAIVLAAIALSCQDGKHDVYDKVIDPENFATMTTTDVNTVISDSGILRYRILAPVWLVYDEASDPKWRFPDGMHMERYDNARRINATIDCDSAVYFTNRDIWKLDGAVDIHSSDAQRFLTEQLFWDRRTRQVYTDSFIHIRRPDRILEGYGLRSNDEFTDYVIINPTGSFPVSQFESERGKEDDSGSVIGQMAPEEMAPASVDSVAVDTASVEEPVQPVAPAKRVRPIRLPRNRPDSIRPI